MKKIALIIGSIALIASLIGCGNTAAPSGLEGYEDSDVAAIVRGKEITIGDLRFLYADEDVLTGIEAAAQTELMIQEAKAKNVNDDLSVKIASVKASMESVTFKEQPMEEEERKFILSQSEKLNMDVNDYFKKYMVMHTEMTWYLLRFYEEAFRLYDGVDEELEAYNAELDLFLKNWMTEHEGDIEILITP
ncbi:hypothetical protein H9649_02170 [Sporosarcina sp. Sa2YVA2]|uniref:Lipoprotein n=1 Tax=Sporosarcina quadrami TaxID=2762234 RepID=A0ABR8U5Q6_9BACL|nr:hypothetical protein [Sporosarcina quadrami]MBD7983372.1 hypothetical protein [Sporosarcina quadrami]